MGARSSQPKSPNLNKADGHLIEYFRDTFLAGGGGTNYVAPPPTGLTATGGVIGDYTDPGPGTIYRTHTFTTSGVFNVTAIGDHGSNVDYLVVAGGGGGGCAHSDNASGGGGAGAARRNAGTHRAYRA